MRPPNVLVKMVQLVKTVQLSLGKLISLSHPINTYNFEKLGEEDQQIQIHIKKTKP